MTNVTVPGANHSIVTLTYDEIANAILARQVAGAIRAGVDAGTIQVADNKNGSPPPVPPGTGELVLSKGGTTLVPKGFDYVVDAAKNAVVYGNGDTNEQVLVGEGNLTFIATAGSGRIITGGGDNVINIMPSDAGSWLIGMGNGNDTVRAFGSGNDTIGLGSGKHFIQLGSGSTFVTTSGSDTVFAAGGSETIDATGSHGKEVIYGNSSQLVFLGGGPSTVIGGSGSDTVFGGHGRQLFEGGSGGNNLLQAGDGRATLFGGGDGDQLYAAGHGRQELHAGSGNETLSGVFASGHDTFYVGSGSDLIFGGSGNNTFVAGTGTATVTASPGTKNLFEFVKNAGGGHELVEGFTAASQVHIELLGFSTKELKAALDNQKVTNGSVTVTLSDKTTVTFQNVGLLSASNFSLGSSSDGHGSGGNSGDHHDHDHDHGHGHSGHW